MDFTPDNPTVVRCVQAMELENKGEERLAEKKFLETYELADTDFEKYLASFFVARRQQDPAERLRWFDVSLQFAKKSETISANSALPTLYKNIAQCHEALGDKILAEKYSRLSFAASEQPQDPGPFFHGTKARLSVGDQLTAGRNSNYSDGLIMNHIYFTAMPAGAGLAAALAKGTGDGHVYRVEPTGVFENDPNVTDKKFPGNPTRSYRTQHPLKITGELFEWKKQTQGQVQEWREKLDNNKGKIIN